MVNYSQVIWTRLYGKQSFTEPGTFQHLKSLINRTNVPPDVKKNVNAAEDFLEVYIQSTVYCLHAAALNLFIYLLCRLF